MLFSFPVSNYGFTFLLLLVAQCLFSIVQNKHDPWDGFRVQAWAAVISTQACCSPAWAGLCVAPQVTVLGEGERIKTGVEGVCCVLGFIPHVGFWPPHLWSKIFPNWKEIILPKVFFVFNVCWIVVILVPLAWHLILEWVLLVIFPYTHCLPPKIDFEVWEKRGTIIDLAEPPLFQSMILSWVLSS